MTYLSMVVDETLRKYPILPFIDRICTDDYKLPNSDVIIPKGTAIFISVLGLQSDPKYYPNPEVFDPERFSSNQKENIIPFTYLPFGGGPRVCIGSRFGLLTTKVGIVEIISNFKISTSPTTPKTIKFSTKNFFLSSDSIMSVIYVTSVIFLYVLYKYLKKNLNYWHEKNIPYIKPMLFFGNLFKTITLQQCVGELLSSTHQKFNSPYIGFYVLHKPALIIKDPEIIKKVLLKDFNSFCNRYVLSDKKSDPMTASMTFFANNPEWKYIRTKLTPVFTSGKLKQMFYLIAEMGTDMTTYLKMNTVNNLIEAKEVCGKFSTNVITSCAFGLNAQSFQDHNAPFRKFARMMFDKDLKSGFYQSCYFVAHTLVKIFKLPFLNPETTSFMRQVFWKSIEQRDRTKEIRNDVIDVIKEFRYESYANENFKFEGDNIVAQASQFFAAGFETVSSTISFALYELSLNLEIQERLRAEINDKLAQFKELNYECLQSMTYLNMIVEETLRKYPVLPFIDRICVEDYKLPNSEVIIPKGTAIFISLLGLQNDPKYYPNPELFDPERFSKNKKENIIPFTYLPFGEGPRNCIGSRFGLLTTKVGIVELISNFKLAPSPDTPKSIKFSTRTFFLSSDVVKDFNYFYDRYALVHKKSDSMSASMMFFAKNPEWKYIRSKTSPVFSSGKLKKMFYLITEMGTDMTSYLKLNVDNNAVDVKEIFGKFATNVITSCAFGLNAHSFQNHNAPFRKCARALFDNNLKSGFYQSCYFVAHTLVKLFNFPFIDREATNFMRRVFWETISQRERSKEIRHDIIDVIMEFKDDSYSNNNFKFEGDNVVAQATQFFLAGFETVSSTLTFALYELSFNLDVQQKLRTEMNEKIAHYEELSYECLQSMTYLSMVVDETLRKYPVVPSMNRVCIEDYEFPNSNLILSKGVPIFISTLGLQNDPQYFPNPQVFDPERFSDDNKISITPFTYLPFGEGPRNCIGTRFALLTIKIALVEVISNFEVTPCPDTPTSIEFSARTIFLTSKSKIPLHMRKLITH
ncbi:hypothetical protein FQR65_LT06023 [Abscondita terminalis]|nr:hypothetical protein FQR65_LT06023 [Abscondita terminalis]